MTLFVAVEADQYTSFKLAFSYTDGITLGYYGCSEDAEGKDEGTVMPYVVQM